MATSKTNIITHGYHGKVGNQFVLRVRGSSSVICAKPDRSAVVPTQGQKDQTERFTAAVAYAREVLTDPELRAYYELRATKEVTAFNRAVADFLTVPEIKLIDAVDYTGQAGEGIRVVASSNIKVKTLEFAIRSADGTVLESGVCLFDAVNRNWVYTTTTQQTALAGLKLVATATDLPGRKVEKTLIL